MFNTPLVTREFLLTDAGLAAVFAAIDELHDAASEDQISIVTPLDQRELVAWLHELAYTVQETIQEIEASPRAARRPSADEPLFWVVK